MWHLEALRLRRAADHLFELYSSDLSRMSSGASPVELENLELGGAASLLYGLSLENLLKGIIIKQGQPFMTNLQIRFGRGSGHNLTHLASKAGLSLNSDEADLLNRLTQFVEWAGRYPVPKSANHMTTAQRNVKPSAPALPIQPYAFVAYDAVFDRAQASLG